MRLNPSTFLTMLLLTSVIFMPFASFARADERLKLLTEVTLIHIQSSFENCYLSMREADLLYRDNEISKYKIKLDELSRCVEKSPASIKSSVDRLRSALANKQQALSAFKDYVLTYRQLLARLKSPSTTLREAGTYSTLLDGKGAKVIAEVEW